MVRAKFKCVVNEGNNNKTDTESVQLKFEPVTCGSEENKEFFKEFFKWTPGGSLVLYVVSPAVACLFKVGEFYYLDLSPAVE